VDEVEREAIAALRQGEIAGLETLIRLHQLRALRTAYAITGDRMAAEDAVADAYLSVYEHIGQFDSARPFGSWFSRIVANRAVSEIRRARRAATGDATELALVQRADPAPGPEEEVVRHELRDLVVLAIKRLPAVQRAALVQRYYLDIDEATIAGMSACPVGTVKSRLHAAKKRLRASFAELRPGVPAGRSEDRRVLRRVLATYLEEAVPADSSVWPAVQRRLRFLLQEIPNAQMITTSPLAADEQPPPTPDFTTRPPNGTYLLMGPPRSGTTMSLVGAERVAGFPVLRYEGPAWQLARVEYSPPEPRRADGFGPPRYAWHMPAVILTYESPPLTAKLVQHGNPFPGQTIRVVRDSTTPVGETVLRVEQVAGADYLVRCRPSDGLVTEVQFATTITRVFVHFDPPTDWATAADFVGCLQPSQRSIAMDLSRRTFLSTASGLAVVTIAGCGTLTHLPGASGRPTRVAGVQPGGSTNTEIKRLQEALETSVAALAGTKTLSIDPRIIWVTPADGAHVPDGQTPDASVVDALGQMLSSANAALRSDLVAFSWSVIQRSGGTATAIGPDAVARQMVRRRLLRPLDDLLRTTPLVKQDDYFPGAWEASDIDGKLYGLPLGIMPTMLLYDKELLDAAGVTVPDGGWGWQQLLEAGLHLTKPPTQYALAATTLNVGLFIEQNGGAIISPDGRQCLLDQPAAIEAAGFYASLFQPRTIVAPQGNGGIAFAQGMMTSGSARFALLPGWASPGVPTDIGTQRLHLAEPFHGKAPHAGLTLQSLLAMTSAATDPSGSFAVMAALAGELQRRLYVPATLAAAKTVDPRQQGLHLNAEEQAAIIQTARYATYGRAVGPDVTPAMRTLEAALQRGQDPSQACRAATKAINSLLAASESG